MIVYRLMPKDSLLRNEKTVKLLGITVDNKLSFEPHLKKLFLKISQKINALARVLNFISQGKLRVIMRVFITSQFSYCPLIWICHDRNLNNKINKLYERALWLAYDDRQSTFEEILNKD